MKLKVKYNIIISIDLLLMLSFYKKVEKRGFRVYDNLNKKEITENVGLITNILMY